MDQTQVKQTYEVFSKLQFVTLNKYIKGMQLLYIALITNQWSIFTNINMCCLNGKELPREQPRKVLELVSKPRVTTVSCGERI